MKFKTIILDAGALILNPPSPNLADKFYTLPSVAAEVRDKRSRERLGALPFVLEQTQPSSAITSKVNKAIEELGYGDTLSGVDKRVVALTYMLHFQGEKEEVDVDTIQLLEDKSEAPAKFVSSKKGWRKPRYADLKNNVHVPVESGNWDEDDFKVDGEEDIKEEKSSDAWPALMSSNAKIDIDVNKSELYSKVLKMKKNKNKPKLSTEPGTQEIENDASFKKPQQSQILGINHQIESKEFTKEEDEELEWITTENFSTKLMFDPFSEGGKIADTKNENTNPNQVGCITTDYALQSILLRLGLCLVSVDGREIKEFKRFVYKCDTCAKIWEQETEEQRKMTRFPFCRACGHPSLGRLFYTQKGSERQYHYKKGRRVNTRGTRYAIGMQKNTKDPGLLLREDQLDSGLWAQRYNNGVRQKTGLETLFEEFDLTGGLGMTKNKMADVEVGYGRKNRNAMKGRERRGKKKKK
eukprot:augustus_masked-scaffold_7-processed-gene-11.68-mRNA-1 protein AED:0.16 eAED:0.20 QI:0/-1/0/1/-1/1/1/0/467